MKEEVKSGISEFVQNPEYKFAQRPAIENLYESKYRIMDLDTVFYVPNYLEREDEEIILWNIENEELDWV